MGIMCDMLQLLHKESESSSKPMATSCKQIVDCLVTNIIKLERRAVELSEGQVRPVFVWLIKLDLFVKYT